MHKFSLTVAFVVALGVAASAQLPALPSFVDNNELTCLNTSQCSAGSPALVTSALPGGTVGPYTYPTYEYLLGTSTSGLPSICGFAGSYAVSAAGWQAERVAAEACRTQHGICGILDLPPGQYPTSSSMIVPQTNTTSTHASCPLIERTALWQTLETMPEPIGAGGIQQNVSASIQIGLRNPSLDGVNSNGLSIECPPTPGPGGALAYQLGETTFCITAGVFTLANGLNPFIGTVGVPGCIPGAVAPTTACYNYLQFMVQLVSTGLTAPMVFCSVAPGANPSSEVCNNPSTEPQFGPDLWYFEGIVFSPSVGNHNNMNLINIQDNGGNSTSIAQWASHIHFRRIALLGDWTNLTAGSNQIATGIAMGQCFYCSVAGSSGTQLLRPTAEGHIISYNGAYGKISNNWLEGQSSCIFAGGGTQAFSITPVGSFISAQDVEQRRTRCTFPVAWLGSPFGPGNVADANPYWGGAGDNPALPTLVNVASGGLTVTYVSGPQFHDSTSFWPGNNVFINGLTNGCWNGATAVKCTIVGATSWPQKCPTFCFPSSSPTILTLSQPVCNTGCTGPLSTSLTNVGFILNGATIARKNCDEKKSSLRYLYSGNIDENVDNSGGQRGICLVLSTRNTSGGGQGTNYQDAELDDNIQNNVFQNTCEANTLGANSASSGGNGGGVAASAQRLSYYNNASLNVTHQNPGCPAGSPTGIGFQINIPFQSWTGTITEDHSGAAATFGSSQGLVTSVDAGAPVVSDTATYGSFAGGSPPTLTVNITSASTNFVVGETVHLPCAGCAGDPGTGGGGELQNSDFVVSALTSSTLTFQFNSNSSTDPVSLAAGTKVQGPAGFQVFNIANHFPVFLSNCSNSSFNTPTGSMGPLVGIGGSTPWNGSWVASNTTVFFPFSNTPDISATCTISNVQGRPNDFYFQKNLIVTDAPSVFGTGNAPNGGGAPYSLNAGIQDNILLNSGAAAGSAGWFNSSATLGEGRITQSFQFDTNTLTTSNMLIPRPSGVASLYAEYCNNANISILNCTPASSNPLHFYFPNSGGAYASCKIGFVNACSGVIPLNLPDMHSYAIAPIVSGIANPFFTLASDGGPLGPNFVAIDAAQTANTYVPMVMGSPVMVSVGPFPDSLVGSGPPTVAPTAPAAKAFAALEHITMNGGVQ